VTPTNSSQSDTIHNHICKEQRKDSFYSEFIQQFIITIACSHLGMAGGCSLFEKKDKLEVKGIYIIFRMCACEGIDALRKQLLYLFSI